MTVRVERLSDTASRASVRVQALTSDDPPVVRRLAELGLTPGAEVTILQRTASALVVSTRDSRVAVGAPIAATVRVEPMP